MSSVPVVLIATAIAPILLELLLSRLIPFVTSFLIFPVVLVPPAAASTRSPLAGVTVPGPGSFENFQPCIEEG